MSDLTIQGRRFAELKLYLMSFLALGNLLAVLLFYAPRRNLTRVLGWLVLIPLVTAT